MINSRDLFRLVAVEVELLLSRLNGIIIMGLSHLGISFVSLCSLSLLESFVHVEACMFPRVVKAVLSFQSGELVRSVHRLENVGTESAVVLADTLAQGRWPHVLDFVKQFTWVHICRRWR